MRLTDFKALTFDCYGTLIDWEAGMMHALTGLVSAEKSKCKLTRNSILEAHARHESEQQRQTPTKRYCDLLSVVYKRLAEEWGVAINIDECEEYGKSIRNWPAFVDLLAALQYLKKFYRLIILSNVDNRSFSFSNGASCVEFDAIYTAEDIGSYKPDDRNFVYMLEHIGDLGLAKGDIPHCGKFVSRLFRLVSMESQIAGSIVAMSRWGDLALQWIPAKDRKSTLNSTHWQSLQKLIRKRFAIAGAKLSKRQSSADLEEQMETPRRETLKIMSAAAIAGAAGTPDAAKAAPSVKTPSSKMKFWAAATTPCDKNSKVDLGAMKDQVEWYKKPRRRRHDVPGIHRRVHCLHRDRA